MAISNEVVLQKSGTWADIHVYFGNWDGKGLSEGDSHENPITKHST